MTFSAEKPVLFVNPHYIAAGGEAPLTVHFDASRTRATGYKLVLFYPS